MLSTGNIFTEIQLDSNANSLIVGENGSGKSTILDALTFSLFGKAFRRVNKSGLVNSVNQKDCRVEIEFEANGKSYQINRGIKPNVFEIYCNGIALNQEAVRDFQEHLEKHILRMNFKSFTQIVILGSASFTPFMQLTPADRRSVIEDLLDIQVFSIMNILAKGKLQTNKENFLKNTMAINSDQEKESIVKRTLESLKQNVDEKVASYKESRDKHLQNLKELQDDVDKWTLKRKEYAETTKDLDNLRNRHKKFVGLHSKINDNLSRHLKDINFYNHNNSCPTCQQLIDQAFKAGMISDRDRRALDARNGLKKLDGEIDTIVIGINKMLEVLAEDQKLSGDIIRNQTLINSTEKTIRDIELEINKLSTSDDMILENTEILSDLRKSLDRLESEKKTLLEERQYLEVAINLLKDGGIKTKIIKQYLPIINKLINKYLSQMGFFVDFNINESFEETIKSRYRDEFSYHNFSEGEKTRIDLAILFTWRAIARMRNSVNTNLLILDEIFDGSLDANGTDEFIKIMQGLIQDTNTFIISHKTEAMLDKFDRVYVFSKKQNFSVLMTTEVVS